MNGNFSEMGSWPNFYYGHPLMKASCAITKDCFSYEKLRILRYSLNNSGVSKLFVLDDAIEQLRLIDVDADDDDDVGPKVSF